MTLDSFWNIIELAWKDNSSLEQLRREAIESNEEELLFRLSEALSDAILASYKKRLAGLSKEELTSFIHHLEERMYHIDRQEIHEYTDGSDDGFLYCRCFIVGMGKEYYTIVDENPSKATADAEAESFGFSAYGIYEELFNEAFDRYTHHSMESCSNADHWDV